MVKQDMPLVKYESTGEKINADIESRLIETIFYKGTPLHDGAIIIGDGKIVAAGCILPLTQNTHLSRELGTRHRAAVGMSENSDAVVVVVSEETGNISLAVNGELRRGFDAITLHNELAELLIDTTETNTGFFARVVGLLSKKTSNKKNESEETDKAKTDKDNEE